MVVSLAFSVVPSAGAGIAGCDRHMMIHKYAPACAKPAAVRGSLSGLARRLWKPAMLVGSALEARRLSTGCSRSAASSSSCKKKRILQSSRLPTSVRSLGFVAVPPPGHPDHPVQGVQPFAEQNGGVDEDINPPPRLYSHGPCGSAAARDFIVDASSWADAGDGSGERSRLVEEVLQRLKKSGFVIVEGMVPPDGQLALEQEAIRHFNGLPHGFFTQPLRADRSQVHVPYAGVWASDWIALNDLVLRVTAKYCINNMACGRSEQEQQSAWINWAVQGGNIDFWRDYGPQPGPTADHPPQGCTTVGSSSSAGPWLGRVMITKAPSGSPLMTRHRDIILPGPCAQLTIMVPLTPLTVNNGPLALRPASHVLETPGYEVVANIPPGAIMLYDSFVDHRAMENFSPSDRYALYYEFETRGIFTGYVEEHFGEDAAQAERDFRDVVDPVLRRYVDEAVC